MRKLAAWYRSADRKTRLVLTTTVSTGLNALLGIGKLILGLVTFSPWFVINAVYYLLLCVGRGSALYRYAFSPRGESHEMQQTKATSLYRHSGIFLCLLGITYLLISIRMFFRGEAAHYPDYIIFGVVILAFIKLFNGVWGIVVDIREKHPLMTAMRLFSFADACVSIVVTRCVLLLYVHAPNAVQSSAFFGMIVSLVFLVTGGFLSLQQHRKRFYL